MDPLELAALRLAIDEQPSEDLPGLAADALARGLDSPALRDAAGASPQDVREARDHFVAALDELGFVVPNADEAVWRLVEYRAKQIVDGEITPYDGASWIWRSASLRVEREGDLRIFEGLASEWEDDPEHRQGYDEQIVEEARVLLTRDQPRRWIKVMADYDCWPLWNPNPPRNVDPAELAISDELAADLAGWAADFDLNLDREDPARSGFSSPREAEAFVARGQVIVDRLQDELGMDWHVEYLPAPTHPVPRRQ